MSKHRMQSLILEVLNAQPSLRDSKQYIKSFGPRGAGHVGPSSRYPVASPFSDKLNKGKGRQIPHAASQVLRSDQRPPSAQLDSHTHPDQGTDSGASTSAQPSQHGQTDTRHADREGVPKDGTQAYLESATSTSGSQQHTALVKIQGPFSRRQLESIADGMVYLKKLGLVSVIVVDGEHWSEPGFAAEFDSNGERLDVVEEQEDKELAPWSGKAAAEVRRNATRNLIRKRQATLRKTMLNDVMALADLLSQRGAPSRPFLSPIFKVDAQAAQEAESMAPRHLPGTSEDSAFPGVASLAQQLQHSQQSHHHPQQSHHHQQRQSPAFVYRQLQASRTRSPLVSEDDLASLRAALATDHIPVIAPLALFSDPEEGNAERSTPVKADDVLVALARDMAKAGKEAEEMLASGDGGGNDFDFWAAEAQVDMMPLRLMVINREGGIPSHARGGNPHLAINLASEYSFILNSFIWSRSHPTALTNLEMVHDCLSYMPHTASGIVVSHRSPRSLIANLITNKAAHSPSLPHSLLSSRQDVRHTPTIIRPGLSINVIEDFSHVDRAKLTALLEASFKRTLNAEAYYKRLEERCDFVIVTGDYQGAAIVTRENAPNDGPDDEPIAYLDKFAVLPSLQGSGTVDFLWGALRDEVQGLGLLDALNDNGGKGGFGRGRDLVWKSRADNPVNRWYYERSNGFMKIDTRPEAVKKATGDVKHEWMLFWSDAEERLSKMSGERRLGAGASAEDVLSSIDEGSSRGFIDLDDDDVRDHDDLAGDHLSRRIFRTQRASESASSSSAFSHLYDPRRLSTLDPRPSSSASSHSAATTSMLSTFGQSSEASTYQGINGNNGGNGISSSNGNGYGSGSSFGSGSPRLLLPLIAPEEQGRLQRWVECMRGIPTAWSA